MSNHKFKFEKAHLERMRSAGMNPEDIAKVYGCHRSSVVHWLRKFGMSTDLVVSALTDNQVDAAITRFNIHNNATRVS